MMFETQFYMTFPDLSYADMGIRNSGPLRPAWPYLAAFERYRIPSWLGSSGAVRPAYPAPARRLDWDSMLFDPPKRRPPPSRSARAASQTRASTATAARCFPPPASPCWGRPPVITHAAGQHRSGAPVRTVRR